MVPWRKGKMITISTKDHTFKSKHTTVWTSNIDILQEREHDENREVEPKKKLFCHRIPPLESVAVGCGAFLNIFISIGFPYSLGVLYDDLMFTFDVGRRDVTLVIALCTGILSAAGAVAGIFINKCGLRYTLFIGSFLGSCGCFASSFATGIPFLIVTLSILTGLGYSLVYVSALVALGKYFPSDNSTVFVFCTMGSAVGIMIFPLIFTEFIEYFGWRGALIILSGICLNSCVFSLLMTPPAPKVKMHNTVSEDKKGNTWFDFAIFRCKNYIIYLVVLCVISGSITSALITLPDVIRTRGYSLKKAAFFLSVESMADIVGRIIYCQLSCFPRLTSRMIFFAASVLFSVSLIIFPKLIDIIALYSGTCFMGLTAGMLLSVYNLVVLDIIGSEKYATAMGFAESACGIGNIIFGAVIGSIAQVSNSFDSSLFLLGLLSISVSGFVSVMYIICFKIQKGKSNSTEQSINEAEGQDNRAFKQDHKKETIDDRNGEENK